MNLAFADGKSAKKSFGRPWQKTVCYTCTLRLVTNMEVVNKVFFSSVASTLAPQSFLHGWADWQVWCGALVLGAILVTAYVTFIKWLIHQKNTPWLSDTTWLCWHFIVFEILGVALDNPWWQAFVAIVVWEIAERILGHVWRDEFAESTQKAVADVLFSSTGYLVGHALRYWVIFHPYVRCTF